MKKSMFAVFAFLSVMCLNSQAKADSLSLSYDAGSGGGYSVSYDTPAPVFVPAVRVVRPYCPPQHVVYYKEHYREYHREHYRPRFAEYRHPNYRRTW